MGKWSHWALAVSVGCAGSSSSTGNQSQSSGTAAATTGNEDHQSGTTTGGGETASTTGPGSTGGDHGGTNSSNGTGGASSAGASGSTGPSHASTGATASGGTHGASSAGATTTSASGGATSGTGGSAACTAIGPGQTLTDAAGNTWTISGGDVLENGTAAGYSANVIQVADVSGQIYQENSADSWWVWENGGWTAASDPLTSGCASAGTSGSTGQPTTGSGTGASTGGGTTGSGGTTSGGGCGAGFLAVGTTCLDDTSGAAPTFQDGFQTVSLHEYVQPGDNWALISPSTPLGRGGPTDNEQGDQWWTNPYNPATPIDGLYEGQGGQLLLGLLPTPSVDSSYINDSAGTNEPYVGTLMNSTTSMYQLFGYFEVSVAVDNLPGFSFQACLESWEESGSWPPEIDIRIQTDGSGNQSVLLEVCTINGTNPTIIPMDATGMHTYGIDWEADNITFYIDDAQVLQVPTPQDGTYTNYPTYWYLLTGANYINLDVDPDPGSLPVYAHVGSVAAWASKPF